ncbi:RecT family recombinase [Lentibacillus sp. N15]|uniref:RecT family recombinase n=1 Tax=Lentibacillus songyuanensis TaxID=3136161 RepID=UPI0031BB671C
MEKALTFTNDQKGLIFSRFVAPQNGTNEEAYQFIEICETFGLNPLLNDIVFQKYGDRVNFITTRDGLLRVATRQEGYVGAPIANVVKEGDEFEFMPSKGEVHHKFGQKRGGIIGAYAVMHHSKFRPVAVFVDFNEYYQANSSAINSKSGKRNTWDKMPSAMIVKVAEVFVLRRQFPLGGLYTKEEMAFNDEETPPQTPIQNIYQNTPAQDTIQNTPIQNVANNTSGQQIEKTEQVKTAIENRVTFVQVNDLNTIVSEIANVKNVEPDSIIDSLGKPLNELTLNEFDAVKDKLMKWLNVVKQQASQTGNQQANQPQSTSQGQKLEPVPSRNNSKFVLLNKESGQAPNGTEFMKLYVEGKEQPIFARTERAVSDAKKINQGDAFVAKIGEENGFTFLAYIDEVKNVRSA